ncbi:MAG: mechanosensitive ion channel family protein [Planctomycetota bacterium]|jgi:MscS family membrane protein
MIKKSERTSFSTNVWRSFWTVLLLLSFAVFAGAQEPTLKDVIEDSAAVEEEVKAVEEKAVTQPAKPVMLGPSDEYSRGVPRTCVLGFLGKIEAGDFISAAEYLDLRYLPYEMDKEGGPELARKLGIVLKRALWIDPETLSTSPEGHSGDSALDTRDIIGTVEVGGRQIELQLHQVWREDGVRIWKIASGTVYRIPELYEEYGYGPLGERLAKSFPSREFLGLQLWQWIMLLGLIIVCYVIAYIPTKIIAIFVKRRKTELSRRMSRFISCQFRIFITLLIANANFEVIHPTMYVRALNKSYTLTIIFTVWMLVSLIGILRDLFIIKLGQRESTKGTVLLRPVTRVIQFLVILIAMLVWFENMGFKATTLLTGLGIGGLALALATQKSIENFIGAVTLLASAPVKIGDFGLFGDKLGTVEEIGLRYTNIRTLDRTVVHVPNAIFADMKLENFTEREKIWFHPKMQLSRKTSPDQIRYILIEVRKMLYSHPGVDPAPTRVRFKGIGENSFDIDIFTYVLRTVDSEYLEVAEDLNLRILDIISEAGAELAVPVRNVWFENSEDADVEAAKSAEKRVCEWRDRKELCLPKFPEERIEELRGTLHYPPEGSATEET